MKISMHALDIVGVTPLEYIEWCEENGKASYKEATKIEFFSKIKKGMICRDKKTGKLINKRPKEEI